jgi:hypothetical protein
LLALKDVLNLDHERSLAACEIRRQRFLPHGIFVNNPTDLSI